MSKVNAPQPDPTGPAETFDSSAPGSVQPTVSTEGLPGPNNVEAIQHIGVINGIDPFLRGHWVINTTITWSTHQQPGTVLFSLPIHPSPAHQWLGHLSKMYNAWAGGIDFSVKVAGTGFHAGQIMIVRVPPNIKPENITSQNDMSIFECMYIDPKTLEKVSLGVMDQRNIMYHYMPLDVNNHQSFGGFFVVMVTMPLITSSTGATQIPIQIWTRPSNNFVFNQLRPIDREVINVSDPNDIIDSLNFSDRTQFFPVQNKVIDIMKINALTTKRYLTAETINNVQFSKDPLNGYFVPRFESSTKFVFENLLSSGFQVSKAGSGPNDGFMSLNSGSKFMFSKIYLDDDRKIELPVFESPGYLAITLTKKDISSSMTFRGNYRKADPTKKEEQAFKGIFQIQGLVDNHQGITYEIMTYFLDTKEDYEFTKAPFGTDVLIEYYALQFSPKFDFDYREIGPPISESLITFLDASNLIETAQTLALAEELNRGSYSGFMEKKQALSFELIDTKVDLPILPIKLHYEGYLTTYVHSKDLIFKLNDNRYKLRFKGRISETDPLLLSGEQMAMYIRNLTVSRINSSPLF